MGYSLHVSDLLPLKAFYLGFSLKDNINLPKVREMVDESIEKCGEREDFQTKKVFYLLLKCELNRDTDNVSKDRKIAKNFCKEEGFEIFFENYMKIIKFTLSTKRIVGGGAFSSIKKEEITDHETHFGYNDFGFLTSERLETPLKSLNLSIHDCPDKDRNFLLKTSLKSIIDKHFGESWKMKISIKTIAGIILGALAFLLYVSNVRPVGWFDSVVGLTIAIIVFFAVRKFKGVKK